MLCDSPDTEHLRRLRPTKYTKYWLSGYNEEGIWDADRLQSVHDARRQALRVRFANEVDNIRALAIGDHTHGLIYSGFDVFVEEGESFVCNSRNINYALSERHQIDDLVWGLRGIRAVFRLSYTNVFIRCTG